MSFPARYSGWCGLCGGTFSVGDSIRRITPVTRRVPVRGERYQPASDFKIRPLLLKYGHEECP